MSRKYVVTIRNLSEQADKEVTVQSNNPMEAHKTAFMSTKSNEEITVICDDTKEVVYDLKNGFKQSY